ncbi:XdhC family protein [Pleomorphovibrio marinus]|uniref:XdhC family protein n=1 Tax=Pleomorphovibrio marinus TaxID=2164132 RepID=UPI000E0B6412|nr:XdhC/CoxI family protein [Pleomorphovibrio marinus]
MKEIKEIISSFEEAVERGEQTALATVVKVIGSSYRRPGARMLVTENGMLTGAISGGCLEGDALKKAQLVMLKKQSMLVTYDTTDEDDAKFGVGLGCNGIIHILIEPIDPSQELHPIQLLKKCLTDRSPKVLATLFDLENPRKPQIGTCWLKTSEQTIAFGKSEPFQGTLTPMAQKVLQDKKSWIAALEGQHAFVELVHAPIRLMIVGAGNDAIPLSKMAQLLGWEVTLIDGRENHANSGRFPNVEDIRVLDAEMVYETLHFDDRTAMVLMTHNFNYELLLLKEMLPISIPYVGVLGPKKKLVKLLENLEKLGKAPSTDDKERLFGPAGLNLGAEAPEEIALSIISEVKAVLSGEKGTFLREKKGPIHEEERL